MLKINESGIYPSIMVHRSNYGQLAVGGAMINRIHEDEEIAEVFQTIPSSGGWTTRFDGGTLGCRILDLPCDIVAMYVEGLVYISGFEGAYDSEIKIEPSCYAVAVFRSKEQKDCMGKVVRPAEDRYVYLWSAFNFADRIRHDGMYDLKNAFDTAHNQGPIEYPRENTRAEWDSRRSWHLIPRRFVPGRVRQILHYTVSSVKEAVDDNFGQGKKFFALAKKRK